jgi:hypothetical protein
MLVYERFSQLAWPRGKQDSPVVNGGELAEWMALAGVGSSTHGPTPSAPTAEVVRLEWSCAHDTRMHHALGVSVEAMRRLVRESEVERVPGTDRYRPVPNRGVHP